MRWRDRKRIRPGQGIEEPLTAKKMPLDDDRLFFLTAYYDEKGNLRKCSVDAEWAEDSHYMLDPVQAARLERRLDAVYHRGSLPENLRAFFAENAHDCCLCSFMDKNGIAYRAYHCC